MNQKMEVIIAPRARSDIASILAWTEENFGSQTLKRYGKLIATAIEQVAANPELAGSSRRPEITGPCRTYHLFFSRKSAGRPRDRIRQPRHFLLYRVSESNIVEIGRVLHDSMELQAHLPDEYRGSPE
jgi:toxin ParE1/3/4